jgi:hypothetical protein
MRIHLYRVRRSYGMTPWGIFTNAFDAGDRATLGGWYFNVHTPWAILETNSTTNA